jgi:hypothetical protein
MVSRTLLLLLLKEEKKGKERERERAYQSHIDTSLIRNGI